MLKMTLFVGGLKWSHGVVSRLVAVESKYHATANPSTYKQGN